MRWKYILFFFKMEIYSISREIYYPSYSKAKSKALFSIKYVFNANKYPSLIQLTNDGGVNFFY